jgi:hypothetical protein
MKYKKTVCCAISFVESYGIIMEYIASVHILTAHIF